MLDPTVRKLIGRPGPADRANCARRLAIMARPPHENRGNSVRHYSCIQVRDHQRIRRKFGYSSNGAANRFLFEFEFSAEDPLLPSCAGFSRKRRALIRKRARCQILRGLFRCVPRGKPKIQEVAGMPAFFRFAAKFSSAPNRSLPFDCIAHRPLDECAGPGWKARKSKQFETAAYCS